MFKNTYTNTLLVLLILFITSCEKSDTPEAENEMEVFTNATIVVTNLSDNSFTTYVFEVEAHDDHDDHGGGGVAPSEGDDDHGEHTAIDLAASSEYEFAITFQNNSDASNSIDMTAEVIGEADDHHIFYEFTDSSLTYESTTGDTIDSNGNPLNLVTKWTTTTVAVIDVAAYLLHIPTSKVGTTRADFGGAVDVEIDFEAHVE